MNTTPHNEALAEIAQALNYLDKQLWPAQSGWSEEMQIAIDNLHFHKSKILNACNEYAALCAVAEAADKSCRAVSDCLPPSGEKPLDRHYYAAKFRAIGDAASELSQALANLAKATGQA